MFDLLKGIERDASWDPREGNKRAGRWSHLAMSVLGSGLFSDPKHLVKSPRALMSCLICFIQGQCVLGC